MIVILIIHITCKDLIDNTQFWYYVYIPNMILFNLDMYPKIITWQYYICVLFWPGEMLPKIFLSNCCISCRITHTIQNLWIKISYSMLRLKGCAQSLLTKTCQKYGTEWIHRFPFLTSMLVFGVNILDSMHKQTEKSAGLVNSTLYLKLSQNGGL